MLLAGRATRARPWTSPSTRRRGGRLDRRTFRTALGDGEGRGGAPLRVGRPAGYFMDQRTSGGGRWRRRAGSRGGGAVARCAGRGGALGEPVGELPPHRLEHGRSRRRGAHAGAPEAGLRRSSAPSSRRARARHELRRRVASFPGTPPLRPARFSRRAAAVGGRRVRQGARDCTAHASGAAFVTIPVTRCPFLVSCRVRRGVDPAELAGRRRRGCARTQRRVARATRRPARSSSDCTRRRLRRRPRSSSPRSVRGERAGRDARGAGRGRAASCDSRLLFKSPSSRARSRSGWSRATRAVGAAGSAHAERLPDGAADLDALRLFELRARFIPVRRSRRTTRRAARPGRAQQLRAQGQALGDVRRARSRRRGRRRACRSACRAAASASRSHTAFSRRAPLRPRPDDIRRPAQARRRVRRAS
jgi:hypothetical protein